jgi:hypothetical protein
MTKAILRSWRQFCWLALAACLNLALPPPALAQAGAPAPATLSAKAQAALKKGLEAAKEQNWESAIKSFLEARKLSPNTPEIYYDLGLAESKIPGRELRAIGWFTAYLVANPDAPNKTAINDRIIELYKVARNNAYRLIELVQDAALRASPVFRDGDLMDVEQTWTYAHNFSASFRTIDLIQDPTIKSGALIHVVYQQARAGDIAGAKKTLALAQEAANLVQNAERRELADKGLAWGAEAIAKAPEELADMAERSKHYSSRDHLTWLLESLVGGTFDDPKYLDLAGHLKSLPSDDPQKSFYALASVATDVAIALHSFSGWPGSVLKDFEYDADSPTGRQ